MKKFSIFNFQFSIIVLVILFFTNLVFAVQPSGKGDYVYNFFLYYDNGQLYGDRDYEIKYEVISGQFEPENLLLPQNAYTVKISNFKDEIVKTFRFDPQKGDTNFQGGKITVKGPYVADGMKANFYSPSDQHLLSIFVSDSSFCNDNNICEASRGEDSETCLADCKKVVKRTPVDLPANNPPPVEDDTSAMILYIILAGSIATGAWFGWKWWQNRSKLIASSGSANFFENTNNDTNGPNNNSGNVQK